MKLFVFFTKLCPQKNWRNENSKQAVATVIYKITLFNTYIFVLENKKIKLHNKNWIFFLN